MNFKDIVYDLLALLCLSLNWLGAWSAPVTKTSAERWHEPCKPKGSFHRSMVSDFTKTIILKPTELAEHFHSLHLKTLHTRQMVNDLMAKYEKQRFGNSEFLGKLQPFKVTGMPDVYDMSMSDLESLKAEDVSQNRFSDLSKVAVFLEQMRLDEMMYEDASSRSYRKDIEQIEEEGLYWLLCKLHQNLDSSSVPKVTRGQVMTSTVKDISVDSTRHQRDYMVLRDTEKLLSSMVVEFTSLTEIHTNQ